MGMTIYDKSTGEARLCESVDGREILESAPDLYSATPPDATAIAAGGDLADTKVPSPKAPAAERGVDLGGVTKKADIVAAPGLAAAAK